jgi:hypothetical protein
LGAGLIFDRLSPFSLWEYQQHVAATSTIREETVDPKNKGFLGKFLGRRAGDEGLATKFFFSYLCFSGGEWHSKTKNENLVAAEP